MKINPQTFTKLQIDQFISFFPGEGLESAHHPFTAAHPDEEHLIYTHPEQVSVIGENIVEGKMFTGLMRIQLFQDIFEGSFLCFPIAYYQPCTWHFKIQLHCCMYKKCMQNLSFKLMTMCIRSGLFNTLCMHMRVKCN